MTDPKLVWAKAVYNAYKATIEQGGEIPPSLYAPVVQAITYLYLNQQLKD